MKTSPINRLQHFSVSVSAWSIEEWVTVRRDKCGRSLSLFTITLANLHGNFGNHITKTIICTKIDWIWLNNISCCISVVAELLGVAFMAIGWIWMDRSTEMKDTKVQGIFSNVDKFINVYINSFSIKNNYFKLLKAECTKPSLLKCDLRPGLRVAVANKEKVGVLLLRSPRALCLIQFCSHPQ